MAPGERHPFVPYRDPAGRRRPGVGDDAVSTREPAWREVARCHLALGRHRGVLNLVAAEEGWPTPFAPARFLVLAHLAEASAPGFTPRRLAWLLGTRPSTLAHHLDILEGTGMITRSPRRLHDLRQVSVKLTPTGRFAAWRLASALEREAGPAGPARPGALVWPRGPWPRP